jgi:IS605 OrfB family transposase
MNSNNTQIVTRKIVIRPTFSERKEWKKKVTEFTLKDLEEQISKYEEWIENLKSNKKIDKEEKERRKQKYTDLLTNAENSLNQFKDNEEITQKMVNRYTETLVRESMESEARRKNYILTWAYFSMIANGVPDMQLKEQKKFIREMLKPAYRVKKSSKGSIFDDVNIDNILGGYGISFNQELTNKIIDSVEKGLFEGGKDSLPSYKYDSPFTVAKSAMGFSHDYDSFEELCEHIKKKDCNLYFDFGSNSDATIARFIIDVGVNRNKDELLTTLCRVYSGEYEYCGSSIQFDKTGKKIILNLTVKMPQKNCDLNENTVVGVDLGIKIPAVCALNTNPYAREFIGSVDDYLRVRTQIQNQRRRLSIQLRNTKGGHGRKKKLKALDRYTSRERNFVKNYNHMVSSRIIKFALKYNAKYINLECLKGYDTDKKVLRNWSYYELQSMIEYKANKYGIVVRKINPCYTSQVCSECGHYEEGQRVSQEKFICGNDGCRFHNAKNGYINADFNAARNIAKSELFLDSEVTKKRIEEAAKYYNIHINDEV